MLIGHVMFDADVDAVLSLAQAASLGLLHFPILNSSLDQSCQNITYKVRPGLDTFYIVDSNFFFKTQLFQSVVLPSRIT